MARIPMWFGTNEQLKCLPGIKRLEIQTADGKQDVCYAAKTKKESFILPYRISVDGYVLAVDDQTYYNANTQQIAYYQSTGSLPMSLPIYSLTAGEILGGTMLWTAIGVVLALIIWQHLMPASSAESFTTDSIKGTNQQQSEQAHNPEEEHE